MTPNKSHHAGLDWIPHTPGDPMPCPPDMLVRALLRSDLTAALYYTDGKTPAAMWDWNACPDEPLSELIGWHPIEQTNHELRKEPE